MEDEDVQAGATVDVLGGEAPPVDDAGAASSLSENRLANVLGLTDGALAYISLEGMLSQLLERIRGALSVDTAAVLLLDEDLGVLVVRAARGLEEEVREGVQVPLAHGFAGRVAAQRRPIVIDDLDHADVVSPILRQKGIRSMLGVPVQVKGRVIGVMHVGTLRAHSFGEDDVALLQFAADRAALGIDRARIAEQRAATEMMQRTLLPGVLPEVPGLRFSAKYLPGGSGVRVGGDWYDVFQLASGKLVLIIGDVVGRGVLAAAVMAEIRTALRAYLTEGHDLADTISLLNELLVSTGRNRGATLAMLELDLGSGELEVLKAGHLPPLIVRPSGEVSLLEQPHGLPVGVSARQRYLTQRYSFSPGSAVLLYTDGLVERRGESIDEGFERLIAAAGAAASGADSSFADRVYRAIVDEALLDDDVALLAVESLPLEEVLEVTLGTRPDVLGGMRTTLERWLTAAGANESERFDIALSTSEAATNAIEHAYGARDANFIVRAEREGNDVTVTVTDAGRWRTRRPHGGGRGLTIMRAMMDSVEVNTGEGGTDVRMIKTLEGGE